MKDAAFYAIQREYNSRLLSVDRDEERLNELQAQVTGLRQDILNNKVILAQLESFVIEQGWNVVELVKQ